MLPNEQTGKKKKKDLKLLKAPHLIPLPQKRQLVTVDGTFHHMDVIIFNTEIQIPKPEHDAAKTTESMSFLNDKS